ncbi:MAG: response regulator [Deltaproteobacteria bacterium]|nr:response regulator [Deltaproteobacteria bacterium]
MAKEQAGKKRTVSLTIKLAASFAVFATLIAAMLTYALYSEVRGRLKEDIRVRLRDVAAVSALLVDAEAHALLTHPSQESTDQYRRIRESLQRVRGRATEVRHVRTMRKNEKGEIVFVVDATTRSGEMAHIGEVYKTASKALISNFDTLAEPLVENGFYADKRGTWLSGYAPFYDAQGRREGIIGVDIAAGSILESLILFRVRAIFVLAFTMLLAVVLGLLLGRRLASPIAGLTQAARRVAEGDLSMRVPVMTSDETGELAAVFNDMTARLHESRQRLTTEIEERRSAQAALSQSEEEFRKLYGDATVGLYKTTFPEGRIITCNNRFARMLGFASSDVVPEIRLGSERYVNPEQREELKRLLLEKGTVDSFEALFYREDNTTFWIRFSARLVDHGENIEGMAVDFTEEKTAVDRLKAAEQKYRGIFENAVEGIFQCAGDGRILSANPAMARLMGYESADQLISRVEDFPLAFFAAPEKREDFFRQISAKGSVSGFETCFLTSDGSLRHGNISARAVYDEGGLLALLEGSLEDATERRRAEELEKARIEAEARHRATRTFLGDLGRQMRTPMNAVTGMGQLLLATELAPTQREYVETLKAAGERMLTLVADMLVLSKAEARTLELEKIPFNLLELVEKTCEAMAEKAHEKNLELLCQVMPNTPHNLLGDPFHLRQVLVNVTAAILGIAPVGEVSVSVQPVKDPLRKDSGEGVQYCVECAEGRLPTESVAALFAFFARMGGEAQSGAGDQALGLRIAAQLVELMGGTIFAKNNESGGCALCFTTFLERQKKSAEAASPSSPLKDLSILVADNDTKSRNLLKEALNEAGARVTEAEDAQSAITLLKDAWMLPRPFDAVLISRTMPDMDGLEAAEIIKIEHLCPVAVLVLGFSATHEDVERAREIGIHHFLKKPLKKGQAVSVLRSAVRQERGDKSGEADDGEGLPPIDILLVEDSETNRFVIRAYLKNTPCRIHIAENGAKAVEKFMAQPFDVVLMDMQMPVMDGYEALSLIRKWEKENREKKTPIIAMTADAKEDDEVRYIDTGFDALLAKPIKKNSLLTMLLHQILGKKTVAPKKEVDRIMDTLGIGGDEPILAWVNPDLEELAPQYLKTLAKSADTMMVCLGSSDFDTVRTLGHRMKGEGNAFGFEAISRLGAVIEDAAARKNSQKISDYVEKLRDFLTRVEIV